MKAQAEKIKLPAWVPLIIREEVFGLIRPKNEGERIILKRLLTDKRMRRVWNELTKHKRALYQTTEEPYYKPRDRTIGWTSDNQGRLQPLSKVTLDDALLGLLHIAYDLAVDPVSPMTHDQAKRAYEGLANIRNRLEEDVRLISKQMQIDEPRENQMLSLFILWLQSRDYPKKHFTQEKPNSLREFIEAMSELAQFFDFA